MFLNVNLRTFCHATEDPSKVSQALEFVLPSGKMTKRKTTGHHGNPILVYESRTGKKSEANLFWNRIANSVSQESLLEDLESRVDDNCVLHVRLDKQKAYLGNIEIVKHEDVIAVSSKIESHPKKKMIALNNAMKFFGNER